jgi:hypothetical protein
MGCPRQAKIRAHRHRRSSHRVATGAAAVDLGSLDGARNYLFEQFPFLGKAGPTERPGTPIDFDWIMWQHPSDKFTNDVHGVQ